MTSLRGFFREFAAVATSSVWPIKKATDYFSLGETPFRLNRGSGGVFTKGYFVPSGPFPEEYVVLERSGCPPPPTPPRRRLPSRP